MDYATKVLNPTWEITQPGTYRLHPGCTTVTHVEPGIYQCGNSARGPFIQRHSWMTDDLLNLPTPTSQLLLKEFSRFWSDECRKAFEQRGFVYKRGVLLTGDPGVGKTALMAILSNEIVRQEGLVLLMDQPLIGERCLQMIRSQEPERKIVVILEDLETLVATYGISHYLSLLDGQNQVNNVIYLATTNYPEKIEARFKNRPSRFDTIVNMDPPSDEARREYLIRKEPSLTEKEIWAWVKLSEGFTIAHLREMIIGCRCLGQPIGDVVAKLRSMKVETSDHVPRNGARAAIKEVEFEDENENS